jgi:hypothetical protein
VPLCLRFVSESAAADSSSPPPLWPLVAVVRVRHNWAVLARGGGTLVDLPSAAAPGSIMRARRTASHVASHLRGETIRPLGFELVLKTPAPLVYENSMYVARFDVCCLMLEMMTA